MFLYATCLKVSRTTELCSICCCCCCRLFFLDDAPRPSIDLFKLIFENSDLSDDNSSLDGEGLTEHPVDSVEFALDHPVRTTVELLGDVLNVVKTEEVADMETLGLYFYLLICYFNIYFYLTVIKYIHNRADSVRRSLD